MSKFDTSAEGAMNDPHVAAGFADHQVAMSQNQWSSMQSAVKSASDLSFTRARQADSGYLDCEPLGEGARDGAAAACVGKGARAIGEAASAIGDSARAIGAGARALGDAAGTPDELRSIGAAARGIGDAAGIPDELRSIGAAARAIGDAASAVDDIGRALNHDGAITDLVHRERVGDGIKGHDLTLSMYGDGGGYLEFPEVHGPIGFVPESQKGRWEHHSRHQDGEDPMCTAWEMGGKR
ncbi:MAG: hypothetical protein EKK48_09455 [Candidatus Melainabacteria bacterium]|nr:MAG: hypothetical protein EKK48_09455 [Candidatus Melainabacteria bacterium]